MHVALITMGIVTFGLLLLPAMAIMAVISFLPLAILYDTHHHGRLQGLDPGHAAVRPRGPQQPRPAGGPDYVQAFVMSLLFYVSLFATSGLLFLVVFFTRRNMALHDILSGYRRHPPQSAEQR